MTWEAALTPTLEQTLNLILSSLANFFGTTIQTIMTNAPEWLAKYAKYGRYYLQEGEAEILPDGRRIVNGTVFDADEVEFPGVIFW